MFRFFAFAAMGLRLRLAFRRQGRGRREINELMDGYTGEVLEMAVARASSMSPEFAEAIAQAPGDGGFWDWLDKFLDSEFGQMLLDLLMKLLIGLIGGAGTMGKVAKAGVKAVALLALFIMPLSARASDDPSPVVADPPPVAVAISGEPDPRGEWSPWWDGRAWQPRWVKGGVAVEAVPFSCESGVTIPTTSATAVARSSTSSRASTGTGRTITLAPGVGMSGDTNCLLGQG